MIFTNNKLIETTEVLLTIGINKNVSSEIYMYNVYNIRV